MLKEMESVYAVYQEKSFSKAAEKLFISQPALSNMIKKIEAEIQFPIFDRSANPIQLTQEGEYYIASIEKIMKIQKEMEEYYNRLAGEKKGTITVGAATFFCAHVFPAIIRKFNEKYPGYTVNLLEANAKDLTKCLHMGVIDLSLDVEILDSAVYRARVWDEEYIVLAVPASFAVNRQLKDFQLTPEDIRSGRFLDPAFPAVGLQHFKDEPFLFLKRGNDMFRRGMKMCKNAGFSPHVVMYLDQLLTSYYVACKDTGIAFVRAGITDYVEAAAQVYFYKIADENSVRNIYLYDRKSARHSQAVQDFIQFMEEIHTPRKLKEKEEI